MMKKAVYPGMFDPFTNGHLDVIKRGSMVFDTLVVSVGCNPLKEALFTVEERMEMIQEQVADLGNVEVDSFSGMLVDYLKTQQTNIILRGIRTVSDFEYEFQRALTNRVLDSSVETVFIMTSEQYSFLNSTLIKEIVSLGGSVGQFVPHSVERCLMQKFKQVYEKSIE
ncbi:MAG: pantetheine-phosphate adenylyltransferase [Candidatus Brocadia sapporoensis]|jgi:pantetheine-phosphate adenylyltransferase|nr:pantetheine-phosphate adenylyltransferase [Candidatus Brocadia sapporoensis]QQR66008.1 MAG: pantetheine-phosphate adenylyltransferase [Candidatus Brocadia sp.]